ncbi:MAG: type III pantothenate kinase [Gammaproteobacteria bacterium]|jgi:type III pantothenate kinase
MRLLVDVGNSAVKWALAGEDGIISGHRFVHRDRDIAGQLTLSWAALQRPTAVFVVNVAGTAMAHILTAWSRQHWSLVPEYVSTGSAACGVTNAYTVAGTLGVDRWAALIGARHQSRAAVCVIDCGTAITLDLLAASGQHLGGLILPGIEMLKQVIREDTAGVRPSADDPLATLFATDTGAAVHGGAVYMAVAAIDRIITDMVATQEQEFEVLITGGDAGTILTLLARPAHHDPELVLKGLAILAGET